MKWLSFCSADGACAGLDKEGECLRDSVLYKFVAYCMSAPGCMVVRSPVAKNLPVQFGDWSRHGHVVPFWLQNSQFPASSGQLDMILHICGSFCSGDAKIIIAAPLVCNLNGSLVTCCGG